MSDRLLGGRYRLLAPLGAGGSATVWRARDEAIGAVRAVKLLDRPDPSTVHRLAREARAMAALAHPFVLRVFALETDPEPFVVMALAEGGSLRDRLAGGALGPAFAACAVAQACAALGAAHDLGIVHRDVKPHNLLLDADGTVLLADFGVALLDDDRRTRTGAALGSLAYVAPEQRLDARAVGPAADVYAAGATLFSLATAHNPVDLFAVDADDPRLAPLHPALRPIVVRATRADPAARYPGARALGRALLHVLPDLPRSPAEPPTAVSDVLRRELERPDPAPPPPPARPQRWWPVALAAAAGAGAVWLALPAPAPVPVPAPAPPAVPIPAPLPAPVAAPAPAAAAIPARRVVPAPLWATGSGTVCGLPATLEVTGSEPALSASIVVRGAAGAERRAVRGALRDGRLSFGEAAGGEPAYEGAVSGATWSGRTGGARRCPFVFTLARSGR